MRKIVVSICIAFVFACAAVISGVMLLTNSKSTNPTAASLADASMPSSVVFEVNGKTDTVAVSPGSTIKVKATFNSRSTRNWYSISCAATALTDEGKIYSSVLDYLSFPTDYEEYYVPDEIYDTFVTRTGYYKIDIGDKLAKPTSPTQYAETDRGVAMSLSKDSGNKVVPGSTTCYYEFEIVIDENIVDDLKIDSFTFGMLKSANNQVQTMTDYNINTVITDKAEEPGAQFTGNTVTIKLRSENSGSDIGDINIGVGGDKDPDIEIGSEPDPENSDKPYFDENGDVVIYLPDDPSKTVKVNYPNMKEGSEGATVKAATSASKDSRPNVVAFSKNEVGKDGADITVEPTKNVIHVQVTPEDDSDNINYYTITCIFTYVRLSDLVAEADVSALDNTTDMNNGFKDPDTFDKDTYEYEVYVPGDTTEITATVVEGYGASNTIELTATNCTIANTSVTSKTPFTVSDIEDKATLELKVTAKGGKDPNPNTHTYKLTFVAVSTDADLKSLVVKGADLKMEAKNDADKAKEIPVDYYYLVLDTAPVQALMTITANDSKATIEVKGSTGDYANYSATKKYDPDTYTIKITSEAGNYNEYTVMLTKRDFLRLINNSNYDFLTMLQEVRGGIAYQYRVSYSYLEWEHGFNDVYVDRFYEIGWRKDDADDEARINSESFNVTVLGHIPANTEVDTFVEQIDATQRNEIKVYNASGMLIYENGAMKDGLLTSEKLIGTGSRVEYGTDVVYCSILGDVNGDGYILSGDAGLVGACYLNKAPAGMFDPIYVRLAGMVANGGSILSADAGLVSSFYLNKGGVTPNDFYDNYVSQS